MQTTTTLDELTMPGAYASLPERWAAVARAVPDRLAVRAGTTSYTFAEVDALSDRLAARLRADAIDDGTPVAALVGHTAEAVICYLGVIKADRIVVLLDPHLPAQRLQEIARLAGSTTCVADAPSLAAAGVLGAAVQRVLPLDDLLVPRPDQESEAGPAPVRGGRDAASIVFTSGSTGRPKGVVIPHDLVLNDVAGLGARYSIAEDDRCAMVLPYGFAAGHTVLFLALLNGASVWSFDPRDGGTRGLIELIRAEQLTTLHCTPHLLRSIAAALPAEQKLDSLRLVSTVGESIHGRDVDAIRTHLSPDASYFNWTGSSEMGALSLYEIPGGSAAPEGPVPAGRLLANKETRILGEDGAPVAEGEAGEILVVSDYLSGGYWGDEENTALRFGVDADGRPFCRQGDLARFDDNGDLVLLGRADAAVKVRGYLVEPGEVESALLRIEGVREVLVLPVVDPPKPTTLIAYVVPDPMVRTVSPAGLRRHLRDTLPEYMVPAAIMHLSELPRNERGKVDRTRLPEAARDADYLPPETEWERMMADVWSGILGIERIGLDDDFMALGGDSLAVEEMLTAVDERFGFPLVSTDLVGATTLRDFTRRVKLGSSSLPRHPDVVTLRADGTGTPVFCFAGAGALALTFLPLSRHLTDQPMYAFQSHGLERRGFPDWTVESSARRFLEIIRIVRPRGPYVLIGHSFGGLVALEIARLLTAAGETVAQVCLLDTYLPANASAEANSVTGANAADVVPTSGRRGGLSALIQRVAPALPTGIPPMAELGRYARARLAGIVPFTGQRQFDAFFWQGVISASNYKLTPYAGRTLVVLAEGNPDGVTVWDGVLTGQHGFASLPGEHSSILREPFATQLAALVRAELE